MSDPTPKEIITVDQLHIHDTQAEDPASIGHKDAQGKSPSRGPAQ